MTVSMPSLIPWKIRGKHHYHRYIFATGHPCYGKLTSVKTRYPPYRGLRFRANWGVILKLPTAQILVFWLDCRLKSGYYSEGEGGSMCKGKISVRINCWHNRLLENPRYITYLISAILVTLIGYSLLKFHWKNIETTRTIKSSQLMTLINFEFLS